MFHTTYLSSQEQEAFKALDQVQNNISTWCSPFTERGVHANAGVCKNMTISAARILINADVHHSMALIFYLGR